MCVTREGASCEGQSVRGRKSREKAKEDLSLSCVLLPFPVSIFCLPTRALPALPFQYKKRERRS